MSKTIHITARVRSELKKSAEIIFKKIGMSTTDAISVFLSQVTLQNGMPFDVKIPNKETVKAMEEIRKGKNVSTYRNSKQMFNDILDK